MTIKLSILRLARAVVGLVLGCHLFAHAQTEPIEVASHWFQILNDVDRYEVQRSADAAYSGNYGISIRNVGAPDGFGGVIQIVKADAWRGQRIVMRSWMRTEDAGTGQMWLRIDADDGVLAMDNMDDRPVTGTTDWRLYEIVMDVPKKAALLVYGAFVVGAGRLLFDSVQILPAPNGSDKPKVTTLYKGGEMKTPRGMTYTPPGSALDAPANLDFELAAP